MLLNSQLLPFKVQNFSGIITARQRSCGTVMYLHLCFILFTRVGSSLWRETSLDRDLSVPGQRPLLDKVPPGWTWIETLPHAPGLTSTGAHRSILMECILVIS